MALILIVLLLGFNPLLEQREDCLLDAGVCNSFLDFLLPELVASMLLQDNDYVEIFAGAGEISGRLRQARYYAL